MFASNRTAGKTRRSKSGRRGECINHVWKKMDVSVFPIVRIQTLISWAGSLLHSRLSIGNSDEYCYYDWIDARTNLYFCERNWRNGFRNFFRTLNTVTSSLLWNICVLCAFFYLFYTSFSYRQRYNYYCSNRGIDFVARILVSDYMYSLHKRNNARNLKERVENNSYVKYRNFIKEICRFHERQI